MKPEEAERLIAEIAGRHGLVLKKDDPAVVVLVAAQELLSRSISELDAKIAARVAAFDRSASSVEAHLGRVLARQIRRTRRLEAPLPPEQGSSHRWLLLAGASFAFGVLLGAAVTLTVRP